MGAGLERADTATPDEDTGHAPSSSRARWPRILGLVALAAAVVAAAVVFLDRRSSSPSPSAEELGGIVKSAVEDGIAEAKAEPPDSAKVYQTILPSLVTIQSERGGASDEESLGAGVIVNADGAILTARHVIAGASSIKVTFVDGTDSAAEVVSEQPENDIAVLQADQAPGVIVPAVLGSTGGLHVGDEAFAIGHPLGLISSLSAGVISGLDRSIPLGNGTSLQGLIQFDAAVNRGNSGGPLLDRNGQVIGIVTAIANPSRQGYFIGIGFAVPIGTAGGAAGAPAR
jgi:S1-C subfamily serine protease